MAHTELKTRAIALRKQGFSYSEIMAQIPVAKSTISDWLHSVGIAKHQKQRLSRLKIAAQKRGAATRKNQRIIKELSIRSKAQLETPNFIKDPLWLLGLTLYWGEGSKQKPWSTSVAVQFMNMDVRAHNLFIRWAKHYLGATEQTLQFELYIHETGDAKRAKKFWARELSIPLDTIRVYFKRHNLNPKKKNSNQNYYGVLRTSLRKSTDLNRKIAGWTEGVIEYLS